MLCFSFSVQEPSGNHTPPQLSPSLSQSTFTTGGSLDVPHIIMQGDARRRRNENYFDDIPRSKLERQMAQVGLNPVPLKGLALLLLVAGLILTRAVGCLKRLNCKQQRLTIFPSCLFQLYFK